VVSTSGPQTPENERPANVQAGWFQREAGFVGKLPVPVIGKLPSELALSLCVISPTTLNVASRNEKEPLKFFTDIRNVDHP